MLRAALPRRARWVRRAASALASILVASAPSCSRASDAPADGPLQARSSLLIVTLDTTRADHLSCYGYERATSPRLDRLAAASHRFDAAYTVMPTTLPSHTTMFTSLNPRETGVMANGYPVPGTLDTLAERLARRAFATAAFVSASPLDRSMGLDQGFARYDQPQEAERRGDETVTHAIEWLGEHRGERFFCFVHLFDAHSWYDAPAQDREGFGAPPGPLPPARDFLPEPAAFSAQVVRASIDGYDAEIHFADRQLGRLLDALDELGLHETTVVAVLSDHGETLDELLEPYGYAFDHGEFLHRRELRVPFVLHVPAQVGPGGASARDEAVTTLDLMPTVLELLGVPCEPPVLGRSLVACLRGTPLAPQPIFAERRALAREEVRRPPSPYLQGSELAVIAGPWHYVRAQARPAELFDLAADPLERSNVAADHAAEVARLEELLEAWQAAHARAGPQPRGQVDPAVLEKLRALGYAADGEH